MTELPTIDVVPAEGLLVLDPETRCPLPPEGAHVPRVSYWLRRLADGDVRERAADEAAPPTKTQRTVQLRESHRATKGE